MLFRSGSVAGLGSAAAPLSLLGASGAGRLATGSPGTVGIVEGASIVRLSSHLTDHDEQSYPQFVFTTSDEPCAQGVSATASSGKRCACCTSTGQPLTCTVVRCPEFVEVVGVACHGQGGR